MLMTVGGGGMDRKIRRTCFTGYCCRAVGTESSRDYGRRRLNLLSGGGGTWGGKGSGEWGGRQHKSGRDIKNLET